MKFRKSFILSLIVLSLLGCDNRGNKQTTNQTNSDGVPQQELALTIPDNLDHSDSILGTDDDNNGVRDDIDQWIDQQEIAESQRKALKQVSRVLQYELTIDYDDPYTLSYAGVKMARAVTCIWDNFSVDDDSPLAASKMGGILQKYMINTKARIQRYQQYNLAKSGSTTAIPRKVMCEDE